MERTMIEQNDKFQRMVKLANADGVAIKARVTDKKTGDLLGFIVHGKANSEYRVEVKDSTLVCNCRAGELGNYCKHRAICTQGEMERKAAFSAAKGRLIPCGVDGCGNVDYESNMHYCPNCFTVGALGFNDGVWNCKRCWAEHPPHPEMFPIRRDTGPRLYRDEVPRPHAVTAVALEERATEWYEHWAIT
jgi:hypothetical protein